MISVQSIVPLSVSYRVKVPVGEGLPPVRLTVTGRADRSTARLVTVSANNQVGLLGRVLPEPLVVRLEDQFGNPLGGEAVTAEVIQGGATFVDMPRPPTQLRGLGASLRQAGEATRRTEQTDANGEARYFLRVESSGGILVQAAAPALSGAGVVQFRLNLARISVGISPEAVVIGDLNGDGLPDLDVHFVSPVPVPSPGNAGL